MVIFGPWHHFLLSQGGDEFCEGISWLDLNCVFPEGKYIINLYVIDPRYSKWQCLQTPNVNIRWNTVGLSIESILYLSLKPISLSQSELIFTHEKMSQNSWTWISLPEFPDIFQIFLEKESHPLCRRSVLMPCKCPTATLYDACGCPWSDAFLDNMKGINLEHHIQLCKTDLN